MVLFGVSKSLISLTQFIMKSQFYINTLSFHDFCLSSFISLHTFTSQFKSPFL